MSKRTPHALITSALQDLDPAPETVLSEAERERADATFSRIVATPVDTAVPVGSGRPHRRRNGLLVALGLMGAAGVAVPVLLGGGSAYASWTATPVPLTGAAATAAGTTCRNAFEAADGGERVVIAERRGEWTFVLLVGPQSEAVCLMPDDPEGSGVPGEDGFFGSYGGSDLGAAPTPAADDLVENGSMSSDTDEGWFIWVEGFVGSDVIGVTVHTSTGLDVEASLAGNRFAAWWPSVEQSSENPDAESWSYTVHLSDGTSRPVR